MRVDLVGVSRTHHVHTHCRTAMLPIFPLYRPLTGEKQYRERTHTCFCTHWKQTRAGAWLVWRGGVWRRALVDEVVEPKRSDMEKKPKAKKAPQVPRYTADEKARVLHFLKERYEEARGTDPDWDRAMRKTIAVVRSNPIL